MRVLLIVIALLTAFGCHRGAVAAELAAGSLSGSDADAERTMQGRVDPPLYAMIAKWLRSNPHRDLTLHLDSPGGSARYGAMLYDVISKHGRVATDIAAGRSCISACTYVWLAGLGRTIGDRAVLGFHSAYCTGPCDPTGVGLVNQSILDILARTEPALAVMVSNTGAMIVGRQVIALARRQEGHWVVRTYDPAGAVTHRPIEPGPGRQG